MVKLADNIVEFEIDGPRNEALIFAPLSGRRLRGKFDVNRVAEPLAKMITNKWPSIVPGQRIGIDVASKTGFVVEPIHDDKQLSAKIAAHNYTLDKEREEFADIDLCTWVHWLRMGVESGVLKLVRGTLPQVEGTPRIDFLNAPPKESTTDKLTAAIEAQTAVMTRLLERMAGGK